MKSFNAKRTDKYLSNETDIHKNLRKAAEKMRIELMGNEALNKMSNLNKKYDTAHKDAKADFDKKHEEMKKRNPNNQANNNPHP